MPTTYAHYRFGKEVLAKLDENERKIIEDNIDIFNYGVYGPDILFYYKPLVKNKIRKLGSKNHHEDFVKIIEYAADKIKNIEKPDAYLAYMYGFICHFALDSYCHGYINYTKATKGLGHNLMESEFDRMLMLKDGHNPLKYKPTGHMKPTKKMAEMIATVYPEIDAKQAYIAIKSIKKYCDLAVAPTLVSRVLIYTALFVSGNLSSKGGMIIKHKKNAGCTETNAEIFRLYNKAFPMAIKLIGEYKKNIYDGKEYSKACYHTFSTEESVEAVLDKDLENNS